MKRLVNRNLVGMSCAFATTSDRELGGFYRVAWADDGTMWESGTGFEEWKQLPSLPQREEDYEDVPF